VIWLNQWAKKIVLDNLFYPNDLAELDLTYSVSKMHAKIWILYNINVKKNYSLYTC